MAWVAGRRLKVKTLDGKYEVRLIGEPIPEAETWGSRVLDSHRNLGWVKQGDPKPLKRRRRRKNVKIEG